MGRSIPWRWFHGHMWRASDGWTIFTFAPIALFNMFVGKPYWPRVHKDVWLSTKEVL